jgi:hypothetical protein
MAGLTLSRENGWTAPAIDASHIDMDDEPVSSEEAIEEAGTEPVAETQSSAEREETTPADSDPDTVKAPDEEDES